MLVGLGMDDVAEDGPAVVLRDGVVEAVVKAAELEVEEVVDEEEEEVEDDEVEGIIPIVVTADGVPVEEKESIPITFCVRVRAQIIVNLP